MHDQQDNKFYDSASLDIDDMHIEITEYYENSEIAQKEIFITAKKVRSKRRKLNLSIVEIAQNIVKAISSSYIGS